jgi:hypothetical protein
MTTLGDLEDQEILIADLRNTNRALLAFLDDARRELSTMTADRDSETRWAEQYKRERDEARAAATPFSFWKSVYEAPVSNARPEVVEKETAETLLRRLIEEDIPGTENTRYILAVMLERKKQLRQTATRETDDATFLIYEQPKSGEVYIIRDPELKLDQVEAVQREVSLMLTPRADAPADAPPEPPAQPTAASESAEAAKPTEEPSHEETPEELPTDSPDAAEPETSQEPTA